MARSENPSEKLREQRSRRDHYRLSLLEAIHPDVVEIDHGLEGMFRLELILKTLQRRAESAILLLHFDQEPRSAVTDDQEIHFPPFLVAQVDRKSVV